MEQIVKETRSTLEEVHSKSEGVEKMAGYLAEVDRGEEDR